MIDTLMINDEVACQAECRGKDEEEKKKIRAEHLIRQRQLIQGERYENPFDIKELQKIKRRETFWFLTGHGPFHAHWARFGPNQPANCRFCGLVDESPLHLLHDCAYFKDHLQKGTPPDLDLYEQRCREITLRIYQS